MMRQGTLIFAVAVVVVIVVVGGCSFSKDDGVHVPDAGPGNNHNNDDDPTAVGPCRVAPGLEADLRLCLDFEDAAPMAVARDASGFKHDAIATAIDLAQRTGEQAARFTPPQSMLAISENAGLALQAVTIEMFVAVDRIAPGRRYWLLDNGGQYFASYGDDNEIRCGVNLTKTVDSGTRQMPVKITDAGWHHVACTYDRNELRVYVDGSVADCQDERGPLIAPAGATTIGARTGGQASEHLAGALDNVHVFARALTPAEICAASGRTSCRQTCPPKDMRD
ncbi:MAG: LamG domain-containing protein [Deltaproteobacteria bacterium]|nr:LamG domain-containing protein [Deltaproteobacteria bacterium]